MYGPNFSLGGMGPMGMAAPIPPSGGTSGDNTAGRPQCPGCGKDCSGPLRHCWTKFKSWCSKHPCLAVGAGVGVLACTLLMGPFVLAGAGYLAYNSMMRDYVPREGRVGGGYGYPMGNPFYQPPFGGGFPPPPQGGGPFTIYNPYTHGFGGQYPQPSMGGQGGFPPQPPMGANAAQFSGQHQPPSGQQPQSDSRSPSPVRMSWV